MLERPSELTANAGDASASRNTESEKHPDLQQKRYYVFSSKLVKFNNCKLEAVRFTQSGSRGKLLITFDQKGCVRFHKMRGIKVLQRYDFIEEWENLDYVFTNSVETTRIDLEVKREDAALNDATRLGRTESLTDSTAIAEKPQVKTIMYYAGHILTINKKQPIVDVFRVNGPLVETYQLGEFFSQHGLELGEIDFMAVPRLDW